jgi:DNA-directed RNA polymerase specialized sigma24 family protein
VIPASDFYHPQAPWPELVRRVRSGDPAAMEDLYRVLSTGVRLRLARQLRGRDINDRVHDLFVLVTESILNGELRQPERLMGYVRTVERRQVASQIDHELREKRNAPAEVWALPDDGASPERSAIEHQYSEMARRILSGLRDRDREVLSRFYIAEESGAEICRAMDLTETQYRLIKSRAKARFVALCRRRMGEK